MVQKIDLSFSRPRLLTLDVDGKSGVTSYLGLTDKPSINDVTLIGNKTSAELYLQSIMDQITAQEIDKIIYGG